MNQPPTAHHLLLHDLGAYPVVQTSNLYLVQNLNRDLFQIPQTCLIQTQHLHYFTSMTWPDIFSFPVLKQNSSNKSENNPSFQSENPSHPVSFPLKQKTMRKVSIQVYPLSTSETFLKTINSLVLKSNIPIVSFPGFLYENHFESNLCTVVNPNISKEKFNLDFIYCIITTQNAFYVISHWNKFSLHTWIQTNYDLFRPLSSYIDSHAQYFIEKQPDILLEDLSQQNQQPTTVPTTPVRSLTTSSTTSNKALVKQLSQVIFSSTQIESQRELLKSIEKSTQNEQSSENQVIESCPQWYKYLAFSLLNISALYRSSPHRNTLSSPHQPFSNLIEPHDNDILFHSTYTDAIGLLPRWMENWTYHHKYLLKFVFYQIIQLVHTFHSIGITFDGQVSLESFSFYDDKSNFFSPKVTFTGLPLFINKSFPPSLSVLQSLWHQGDISNFDYIMRLNEYAGRTFGNPNNHPIIPWVVDFTGTPSSLHVPLKYENLVGFRKVDSISDTFIRIVPLDQYFQSDESPLSSNFIKKPPQKSKGWSFRDLSRSIVVLKRAQMLAHQFQMVYPPHHIDQLLNELVYFVFCARSFPLSMLKAHVRINFNAKSYPSSMIRMYQWAKTECIPEFFTTPDVFLSKAEHIQNEMYNIDLPWGVENTVESDEEEEDFLKGVDLQDSFSNYNSQGNSNSILRDNLMFVNGEEEEESSDDDTLKTSPRPDPDPDSSQPPTNNTDINSSDNIAQILEQSLQNALSHAQVASSVQNSPRKNQKDAYQICIENFLSIHNALFESVTVSQSLHLWINLVFGHLLKPTKAAIKQKNIILNRKGMATNPVSLFKNPHPPRQCTKNLETAGYRDSIIKESGRSRAETLQKVHSHQLQSLFTSSVSFYQEDGIDITNTQKSDSESLFGNEQNNNGVPQFSDEFQPLEEITPSKQTNIIQNGELFTLERCAVFYTPYSRKSIRFQGQIPHHDPTASLVHSLPSTQIVKNYLSTLKATTKVFYVNISLNLARLGVLAEFFTSIDGIYKSPVSVISVENNTADQVFNDDDDENDSKQTVKEQSNPLFDSDLAMMHPSLGDGAKSSIPSAVGINLLRTNRVASVAIVSKPLNVTQKNNLYAFPKEFNFFKDLDELDVDSLDESALKTENLSDDLNLGQSPNSSHKGNNSVDTNQNNSFDKNPTDKSSKSKDISSLILVLYQLFGIISVSDRSIANADSTKSNFVDDLSKQLEKEALLDETVCSLNHLLSQPADPDLSVLKLLPKLFHVSTILKTSKSLFPDSIPQIAKIPFSLHEASFYLDKNVFYFPKTALSLIYPLFQQLLQHPTLFESTETISLCLYLLKSSPKSRQFVLREIGRLFDTKRKLSTSSPYLSTWFMSQILFSHSQSPISFFRFFGKKFLKCLLVSEENSNITTTPIGIITLLANITKVVGSVTILDYIIVPALQLYFEKCCFCESTDKALITLHWILRLIVHLGSLNQRIFDLISCFSFQILRCCFSSGQTNVQLASLFVILLYSLGLKNSIFLFSPLSTSFSESSAFSHDKTKKTKLKTSQNHQYEPFVADKDDSSKPEQESFNSTIGTQSATLNSVTLNEIINKQQTQIKTVPKKKKSLKYWIQYFIELIHHFYLVPFANPSVGSFVMLCINCCLSLINSYQVIYQKQQSQTALESQSTQLSNQTSPQIPPRSKRPTTNYYDPIKLNPNIKSLGKISNKSRRNVATVRIKNKPFFAEDVSNPSKYTPTPPTPPLQSKRKQKDRIILPSPDPILKELSSIFSSYMSKFQMWYSSYSLGYPLSEEQVLYQPEWVVANMHFLYQTAEKDKLFQSIPSSFSFPSEFLSNHTHSAVFRRILGVVKFPITFTPFEQIFHACKSMARNMQNINSPPIPNLPIYPNRYTWSIKSFEIEQNEAKNKQSIKKIKSNLKTESYQDKLVVGYIDSTPPSSPIAQKKINSKHSLTTLKKKGDNGVGSHMKTFYRTPPARKKAIDMPIVVVPKSMQKKKKKNALEENKIQNFDGKTKISPIGSVGTNTHAAHTTATPAATPANSLQNPPQSSFPPNKPLVNPSSSNDQNDVQLLNKNWPWVPHTPTSLRFSTKYKTVHKIFYNKWMPHFFGCVSSKAVHVNNSNSQGQTTGRISPFFHRYVIQVWRLDSRLVCPHPIPFCTFSEHSNNILQCEFGFGHYIFALDFKQLKIYDFVKNNLVSCIFVDKLFTTSFTSASLSPHAFTCFCIVPFNGFNRVYPRSATQKTLTELSMEQLTGCAIAIGTNSGNIFICDCSTGLLLQKLQFSNSSCVISIDIHPGRPLGIVNFENGQTIVFSTNTGFILSELSQTVGQTQPQQQQTSNNISEQPESPSSTFIVDAKFLVYSNTIDEDPYFIGKFNQPIQIGTFAQSLYMIYQFYITADPKVHPLVSKRDSFALSNFKTNPLLRYCWWFLAAQVQTLGSIIGKPNLSRGTSPYTSLQISPLNPDIPGPLLPSQVLLFPGNPENITTSQKIYDSSLYEYGFGGRFDSSNNRRIPLYSPSSGPLDASREPLASSSDYVLAVTSNGCQLWSLTGNSSSSIQWQPSSFIPGITPRLLRSVSLPSNSTNPSSFQQNNQVTWCMVGTMCIFKSQTFIGSWSPNWSDVISSHTSKPSQMSSHAVFRPFSGYPFHPEHIQSFSCMNMIPSHSTLILGTNRGIIEVLTDEYYSKEDSTF